MIFQMSASQIQDGLRAGEIKIAVIGLGQVGLPLALYFANEGVSVVGADIDAEKVNLMKQGTCPIDIDPDVEIFKQVHASNQLEVTADIAEAIRNSSIHIICAPTPLTDGNLADLSAVVAVSEILGRELKKGSLVILESTVYPGTTNKIVRPILEKSSGLKAGKDFGLAHCFERIDPGNTGHRLDNTAKIVGAVDELSADTTAALYSLIIKAPIIKVRNCETAETVKLMENTYRDINIAFSNELALLCQRLNIDVLEVIGAASTKWNYVPHVPGAGVGGRCIPVSPYYLLQCARDEGVELKLVQQAREINESMPTHMLELIKEALGRIEKSIKESKICILGLAYKADIGDARGGPAEEIVNQLTQLEAKVVCYDPLVTQAPQGMNILSSFEEAVRGSDCIVITTDHSAFKSIDLQNIANLANKPLAIVDGRHVLVPKEVTALGITYIGVGRNENSNLNIWNSGIKADICIQR